MSWNMSIKTRKTSPSYSKPLYWRPLPPTYSTLILHTTTILHHVRRKREKRPIITRTRFAGSSRIPQHQSRPCFGHLLWPTWATVGAFFSQGSEMYSHQWGCLRRFYSRINKHPRDSACDVGIRSIVSFFYIICIIDANVRRFLIFSHGG
jgi:hypothetical protein